MSVISQELPRIVNTAARADVLIIHPDSAWSTTLGRALGTRGVLATKMRTWIPEAITPAGPHPQVVVVFLGAAESGRTLRVLDTLRWTLEDPRVIVVTAPHDAATTRAALLAGAADCVEDSPHVSDFLAGLVVDVIGGAARQLSRCDWARKYLAKRGEVLEHREFLDRLARHRDECRQGAAPMSILMLDIDRFRDCNETHSPAFGDFVLQWLADTIRFAFSGCELIARYHGDRFIVALPGVTSTAAIHLADDCRRFAHAAPPVWEGESYEIGLSAGVAESSPGYVETEHMLIRFARLALEDAKHRGANQTRSWSDVRTSTIALAQAQGVGPDDIRHWVVRTREQVRSAYHESTQALVAAAEAKEAFAARHSHKVSCHAEGIARKMGLRPQLVNVIRKAAVLHDVGKIGVPDAILMKPGPLTHSETEVIRRHPVTGVEILRHIRHLDDELPSILHHHERYDGSGYPQGLSGTQIPIGARIIAVADAIDVMLTTRSYKQPYGLDRVREELRLGASHQFDPTVVAVAMEWLEDPRSLLMHQDQAG